MEHATKRPRIEAEGNLAPSGHIQQQQQIPLVAHDAASLQTAIDSLPSKTVKDLLLRAALHDNLMGGAVGGSIFASVDAIRNAERVRVINFDHYSKSAWHVLNTKYVSSRGSREYDMAGDAEAEVERMLDTILKQTTANSSYGTKKSAAETMRKIFKSVCLADGVIGHEVRNSCFGWGKMLEEVLLERMDDDEIWKLVSEENGEWLEKFRSLVSLSESYGMFDELQSVLEDLDGLFEAGDENEEAEGDEEEDELDGDGN